VKVGGRYTKRLSKDLYLGSAPTEPRGVVVDFHFASAGKEGWLAVGLIGGHGLEVPVLVVVVGERRERNDETRQNT
jgi:hypothetical protein